jgi:uncharacterized protein (DUF302 family)
MLTTIPVERFTVISSRPINEILASISAAIGHPDMAEFSAQISASKTFSAMEAVVHAATGNSSFMQFMSFDLGEYIYKDQPGKHPAVVRLVIGNPLIMRQMVKHVPDAGSYAPVTILITERTDGVHLSYDRMASFIAPYGNPEASTVAEDLDSKVESLLTAVAE